MSFSLYPEVQSLECTYIHTYIHQSIATYGAYLLEKHWFTRQRPCEKLGIRGK
jgi:hypothetical protein